MLPLPTGASSKVTPLLPPGFSGGERRQGLGGPDPHGFDVGRRGGGAVRELRCRVRALGQLRGFLDGGGGARGHLRGLLGLYFTVDLEPGRRSAVVEDGLTVGDVGLGRKAPLAGASGAVLCVGAGEGLHSGLLLLGEPDEGLKQRV